MGTAQNATTTRAMITQPAHPCPARSGLLLNVTAASFLWVHDAACAPANLCEFCEDSLKTGCVVIGLARDRPVPGHDERHEAEFRWRLSGVPGIGRR
jgi:hypothetical protein